MSNGPSPTYGTTPLTFSAKFDGRVTMIESKVRNYRLVMMKIHTEKKRKIIKSKNVTGAYMHAGVEDFKIDTASVIIKGSKELSTAEGVMTETVIPDN